MGGGATVFNEGGAGDGMLLRALEEELERNIEAASSTKRMIDRERDMLQGDLEDRLVLQRFHTDIWDSLVNRGSLEDHPGIVEEVAAAYRAGHEFNQIVDRFNQHGNQIMHTPLLNSALSGYGRKQLIEILREKADEASVALRDARDVVAEAVRTTCPVCDTTFPSRQAMKSHRAQKDDPAHRAAREPT